MGEGCLCAAPPSGCPRCLPLPRAARGLAGQPRFEPASPLRHAEKRADIPSPAQPLSGGLRGSPDPWSSRVWQLLASAANASFALTCTITCPPPPLNHMLLSQVLSSLRKVRWAEAKLPTSEKKKITWRKTSRNKTGMWTVRLQQRYPFVSRCHPINLPKMSFSFSHFPV